MRFFVMIVTAVCVISHWAKMANWKKKNIKDKVGINGENNCKVVRTFYNISPRKKLMEFFLTLSVNRKETLNQLINCLSHVLARTV